MSSPATPARDLFIYPFEDGSGLGLNIETANLLFALWMSPEQLVDLRDNIDRLLAGEWNDKGPSSGGPL